MLCCSHLFADSNFQKGDKLYATKVKDLYAQGDNQKAIGRLLPTAEVEVVEVKGDKLLIKISGYVQEGAHHAIYFAPNRRILNAALGRTAGITPKIGADKTPKDSVQKWNVAEVTVWSDSANLNKEVQSLYKQANESYVANCSICHSLYETTKFNANQWSGIVKSMSMRSGMDKESMYLLTQYLQKNASDMPKSK
ncbi:hypothetical protein CCZ01_09085 [Helicobacter monodelphidis]|nr:hypothetical protein CCZ01_09085 [Helicobacter sp. 15-1451]